MPQARCTRPKRSLEGLVCLDQTGAQEPVVVCAVVTLVFFDRESPQVQSIVLGSERVG